jgi:N-acetylglucosaminyl-diphospho-decaprenol L-rhamnosyltransferase
MPPAKAKMIDLDIVIVNWNTGFHLRDCLQSITQVNSAPVFRLRQCIVVDNASEDGSADDLERLPLPLTLVRNRENKGFAYACNQGAKTGKSENILFLNPDSRLFPGSLAKPVQFLEEERNERVGILGIQIVDENGVIHRNVARFPTPKSLFFQMLGLDRLWPRRFPSHFVIDWDHRDSREVDQVTGAFYLVRRKVFEELRGFDERFFMYFEDLDFAYRAKQAGWKSYYLAETQALHYGGGASYQIMAKRLYYTLYSRALYIAKHYGFPSAIEILLASFLVEFGARFCWSLVNLSKQNLITTLQAYRMLIKTLPRLLRDIGR